MKILNYGSMNVDHVYEVDHIVRPGETLNALGRHDYPGGKGLNQSIAVARAGGDIYQIGVLGADGEVLERALKENRIHTDFVKHVPGGSAHTMLQVDRNGQNSIIVFADEAITFTDAEMEEILSHFSAGDAVIFQNELARSPVFMQKAADRGLTVIFNPSPMEDSIFAYPLDRVSWFVINEIEGAALTGKTAPEEILAGMANQYPGAGVVLTLGSDGAWAVKGEERCFQPETPSWASLSPESWPAIPCPTSWHGRPGPPPSRSPAPARPSPSPRWRRFSGPEKADAGLRKGPARIGPRTPSPRKGKTPRDYFS